MRFFYQFLALAARFYPLERGRTYFFGHFVLRKPLGGYLQTMKNPIRMKTGFTLRTYDNGDFTSLWFRLYRHYENGTKKLILKHCDPGSIFLDLGANMGLFSIGIPHLRRDMMAIAVEPNPITHKLLLQTIRDNRLEDRVHAFEIASGEEDAEAQFFTNMENSGDSSMAVEGLPQSVTVKVRALDRYEPLLSLISSINRKISCVKMDIQGAEVHALRGMRGLLAAHQPVLIIELDEECLGRFGLSREDLYQEIENCGYEEVGFVETNIVAMPVKR